jgi:hypothetical protein
MPKTAHLVAFFRKYCAALEGALADPPGPAKYPGNKYRNDVQHEHWRGE